MELIYRIVVCFTWTHSVCTHTYKQLTNTFHKIHSKGNHHVPSSQRTPNNRSFEANRNYGVSIIAQRQNIHRYQTLSKIRAELLPILYIEPMIIIKSRPKRSSNLISVGTFPFGISWPYIWYDCNATTKLQVRKHRDLRRQFHQANDFYVEFRIHVCSGKLPSQKLVRIFPSHGTQLDREKY